jgi:sulfur carrier protein ThiS adenylyltransferase
LKVSIVGAGSIGSNLCLLLARLGVEDITVYDDDLVEDHNLGHQAFRIQDIGKKKVEALKEVVLEATGIEIKTMDTRVERLETDILVLGVDNMKSRKDIFENSEFSYYVDGRMGGETFNIFAGTKIESQRYQDTLYSDEDASEAPCGGKSIGYVSYLVAALMEIVIKKMILGEVIPFEQNFCAKNLLYDHELLYK